MIGTAISCATGSSADCTGQLKAAAGSALSDIGSQILLVVATAILTLANWFLGMAGVLFNLIMYYGVFQFGNTVGNSPGVLAAWGILRDLANMALLFGFIFMGIATILDTGAVQNFTAKRALPSLLIFAILMNFSLFTCEAMIDISNALSSSMYSQANTDPCTGDTSVGSITQAVTGTSCGINYGLAGHIMQSTGLAGIWSIHGNTPLSAQPWAFLGLALFATIGAIVFFAAAIMLAIRVIILTFLMVASPIGFAGLAIPPLRRVAGEWWTRVIHQAFYAPIMLLLILISLKIADSFTSGVSANNGLADAVLGQSASMMGVFIVFMLVIGFMVASLIVANRFGAVGASAAVGAGKKIVLGSYGFVGGHAGRRTIGATGNWAQKKYNASVASGRLHAIAGTKIDDVILGGLKKTQEARFGSSKSYKEDKEHHNARHKELAKVQRIEDVKKFSNDPKKESELRQALKQLSDTEIIESDLLKSGDKLLADIATNTSPERFEKIMNSDKVPDDTKDKMREERFKGVNDAYAEVQKAAAEYAQDPTKKGVYDDARKEMAKKANELTDKDFGQFVQSKYSGILAEQDFAGAFSDDSFKDRRKNSNLTPAQQAAFDAGRNTAMGNMDAVAERVPNMNIEDIMKLKSDALSNPKVLSAMSGRKLAHIDPNKIGNDSHKDAIVKYIKDVIDPANSLYKKNVADDFNAQYNSDPRIKQRWQANGL